MQDTLHLAGFAAALISCAFWLAAAFIRFRPLSFTTLRGAESIPAALQRQSLLNAVAAIFAAIAAATEAIDFIS